MRSRQWRTNSEQATESVARRFAENLTEGDNVLLYGEMGSGKTTFVRGVVSYFNSELPVDSPSYTLIQPYPTEPSIYHVDLYRLDEGSDLLDLGLDELFDSDAIVMVEWAEKCRTLQPTRYYRILIELLESASRRIQIEEIRSVAGRR
jgi:tRNA threonylcarbamoyladenosine biosynthesis protein TsaE